MPLDDRVWLIWNNAHVAWHRPDLGGYTHYADAATRFRRHEADQICRLSMTPHGPADIAVLAPEAMHHLPELLAEAGDTSLRLLPGSTPEASSSLTFKALRDASVSRCERWHPGGVQDWTLSDWAVAAAGELGEACNTIKKLNRERDGLRGNTLDEAALRANLAEELADTVIYLSLLAERAFIDLESAVIDKFNVVSRRNDFPERL